MQSIRVINRALGPARYLKLGIPIRMSGDISSGSMGRAWKDREHAAETKYFNKKDAEVLAELAKKLQNHTQVSY